MPSLSRGAHGPIPNQLPTNPMNKSILLSKTFWVQVLALVAMLFPAARDWLAANPVEGVALLGAVNVVIRFVTSGKVSLSGGGVHGISPLLLMTGAAAGCLASLPSCSAVKGVAWNAGLHVGDGWTAADRDVPRVAIVIQASGK